MFLSTFLIRGSVLETRDLISTKDPKNPRVWRTLLKIAGLGSTFEVIVTREQVFDTNKATGADIAKYPPSTIVEVHGTVGADKMGQFLQAATIESLTMEEAIKRTAFVGPKKPNNAA